MTARWVMLAALAGCALTSKAAPRELRYFAPSPVIATSPAAPPVARVRLGRITASGHLRYPIEHRTSDVEIAPYETLRWTELPDAYVRRSLSHALFEARPIDQVIAGAAATLDVEILAFEEVARAGQPAGRVHLRYELRDDRRVLAHGRVVIERPAGDPSIDEVVVAIGAAMDAATSELADRVAAELGAPAPAR
jgi:ABC-type uncharacterized transport system auxiliary subunit